MSNQNDIVERLRNCECDPTWPSAEALMSEAADLIQTLRGTVATLVAGSEKLTRDLKTVLDREAETILRHDSKLNDIEAKLEALTTASASSASQAAKAEWARRQTEEKVSGLAQDAQRPTEAYKSLESNRWSILLLGIAWLIFFYVVCIYGGLK